MILLLCLSCVVQYITTEQKTTNVRVCTDTFLIQHPFILGGHTTVYGMQSII